MKPRIHLDFITVNKTKDSVLFEGYIEHDAAQFDYNALRCNNHIQCLEAQQKRQDLTENQHGFEVSVSLDNLPLSILFQYEGVTCALTTGMFTKLPNMSGSYHIQDDVCLQKIVKSIRIVPTPKNIWQLELLFCLRLLGYWRLDRVAEAFQRLNAIKAAIKSIAIVGETLIKLPGHYYVRFAVRKRLRHKNGTQLWLVSDRIMAAGDNGEALFRYIEAQNGRSADVRFVLSKKSDDYERISEMGTVVDTNSLKYKILFLCADKIISSHADIETINPFLRQYNHVVDMFRYEFIFLQHGVTKDDVSSWLNRYERNIRLFITTGNPEYKSIFDYPYDYTKDNVLLSGFPRYDLLENNPQRKIILAPTYRADLLKNSTNASGERAYDPSFRDSAYFAFYNNMINDQRLIDTLKQSGTTIEFYIHPNFSAQIRDFDKNEHVTFAKYPYDYKKAFSEGSLLVTDYSSVAFDFAYLQKPVIYAQFDEVDFFKNHSYRKGYFSYQNDGFGPVFHDYKSTIDAIIASIDAQFTIGREYSEKTDQFFAFDDKNNSRRVYEALQML